MTKKKKTVTVKASQVAAAIHRARTVDYCFQACVCEIAVLPRVAKLYREVNRDRMPHAHIIAHRPPKEVRLDWENIANDTRAKLSLTETKAWARVPGWTFEYGVEGLVWNRIGDECYSHNAANTYDGMRRETICQFIYDLYCQVSRMIGREPPDRFHQRELDAVGLVVVNDLGGDDA